MVKLRLYTDNLVVYESSRFHVQQALADLHFAVSELGLTINLTKIRAMKIRRGARVKTCDMSLWPVVDIC